MPTFDTENDFSPTIQIITWLLLATMLITVAANFMTLISLRRPLGLNDLALGLALAFAIAQNGVIFSQAGRLLGQPPSNLTSTDFENAMKAQYISRILTVPSMFCAKISIVGILYRITPVPSHKVALTMASIVIASWALSSIFAIAFQCPLPSPWICSNPGCFNLAAFYTYTDVVNIFTDCMLVILPATIVSKLVMPLPKRLTVLTCFACRTIVIAATVVQVVFLRRIHFDNQTTYKAWKVILMAEVVQGLSVITACFPSLKPFFSSLESSYLRADDIHRYAIGGKWTLTSSRSAPSTNTYIRLGGMREGKPKDSKSSKGGVIAGPSADNGVLSVQPGASRTLDDDVQHATARERFEGAR